MTLSIGILGTRGIPNFYGGFEQVASYLSAGLVKKGHMVSVYSPHDHPYADELWKGVQIIRCYDPPLGTTGQFIYDLNCLRDAGKRDFDILLLLGYTSSSLWGRWYPKGPVVINNMDGLEWKRSKYPWAVRQFLRYAERLAVRFSDYYVADSTVIRDYLQWQYGIRGRFIPYGAEVLSGEKEEHLRLWGVKKGQYDVVIARMEPENNLTLILEGFCLSHSANRHLVVVGDTSNGFGKQLREQFSGSPQIIFAGALFDQDVLHSLKAFCGVYFHGHSVGGTNPSLLEAMASRALIAAHDNPFNRTILGGDAYYFTDKEGVRNLLDRKKEIVSEAAMIDANAWKIVSRYTWERITGEYEKFMMECYAEKHSLLPYPAVPGLSAV